MNAKKCDKCGEYYDAPMCRKPIEILLDYGHETDRVDLCPSCYENLCDWVLSGERFKDVTKERIKWFRGEK